MQISEKLYLLGHLASPGRGQMEKCPKSSAGTERAVWCVSTTSTAPAQQRPGPQPQSGHIAILWPLHWEDLQLRGPCPQNQGPCGGCLGNPAWSGGLLCPQDCSFRNQSPKNSNEDCSPEKKGSCGLREAATGCFQHRRRWEHSGHGGKHVPAPRQSPPLLPSELDFPAGVHMCTHTHTRGRTYVCGHTHTHPTCAHRHTDAHVHRCTPPTQVHMPSCTCLYTHVHTHEHAPHPHDPGVSGSPHAAVQPGVGPSTLLFLPPSSREQLVCNWFSNTWGYLCLDLS